MTKLTPVRRERLSPREFLKLIREDPSNIRQSQFVPPIYGGGALGLVEVEYRRLVLKPHTSPLFYE
jgi:hypothetical protein